MRAGTGAFRRPSWVAALLVLALAGLGVPLLGPATPADAFGTINGTLSYPGAKLQRAEHEKITRAALACAPGVKSDGSCFEPNSLDQLAGKGDVLGAVGTPDADEFDDHSAHCDNADYLNVPGYPATQTRAVATATLLECVHHLQARFVQGVGGAAGLLDVNGDVKIAEVDLTKSCSFLFSVPGRSKCEAIEGFGRALHGAQDFYSHSNWADESDPAKPIGIDNPPGLNLAAPSPILNLKVGAPTPSIPVDLTTGYFSGALSDKCPGTSGRVTHACLNKDNTDINPVTGVATDPLTVRGSVPGKQNEQKAVTAAIAETKRQWADFRDSLTLTYGAEKGQRMALALTQDLKKVDLVFAIDTTGSMSPYIASAVANANTVLDKLSGHGPNSRITDYRIGLVDYKDVDSTIPSCPPDTDASTDLRFTSTRADIVAALGTLPGKVGGGCDTPEDVLSGIQAAVNFPWRDGVVKAILVMGDAPGHDPEAHSGLTSQSVIDAANAVDPASIYPILVGFDSSATAFMTRLANGTGGRTFDSNAPGGVGQALLDAITTISSAPASGDVTPPTVTVSFPAPPAGQGGVFNALQSPVTGTVSASDASGVSAIDCIDGAGGLVLGDLTVDGSGRATRTVTVTGDGEHLVQCLATDASASGNTGAADGSKPAASLLVDSVAPAIGCSVSPSQLTPADGRLVTVDATVTVDDAFSGPGTFKLQSVTSSEPGSDSGIQGFDVGTADTSGQLRADATGSTGRVYTLTYQGTDLAGNAAGCEAVVTVPPRTATGTIGVDTMVNTLVSYCTEKVVSAPVTTTKGGELLLAYVSSDGPSNGVQQVQKVTGGGLTWTLAARANAVKGTGAAEVWQAYAAAPLTKAAIQATMKATGYDVAITVVAYTGTAKTVGATSARGATTGAAAATLTTTAAGAQVWAVGHDWSRAAPRTVLPGQRMAVQNLDKRVGDTSWVQNTAAVPTAGTVVTVGTSAPSTDRWELAAVEIRPAG
ncbi:vWA domain-containing protein [Dactylosporangium sp. NPDC049140]|uniref:vWA domain-containing protein n=1 Tax=Dactylosporangium sp. NPDC049140 TaxID=3155647 RepID=UPI0033C13BD5